MYQCNIVNEQILIINLYLIKIYIIHIEFDKGIKNMGQRINK